MTAAVLAAVVVAACGTGEGPSTALEIETADAQAASGGVNSPQWMDAPYVVLVSMDGFAARYMQQYAPETLNALAARGAWAPEGMVPVFPVKTFPNHYSLATGLHPARHGVVANTFYDPDRDETYRISDRDEVEDGTWYAGEPIWVTAERRGMVAGAFYWVGTEADVGGVRPSYWRIFDASVTNAQRVDGVLAWLAYPAERRPHLLTLYFNETDNVGHDFGPDSPELEQAVTSVDRALRRLLDGIEALDHGDRVIVIVVSDHGMDGFLPETTEYVEDAVESLEGIQFTGAGSHANLWIEGGRDRAIEVRDRINAGLEHVAAYLPDETPEVLHYRDHPRLGDLVLVPDSGWVVYPRNDRPARPGFTHGWDSRNLAMRALFVAAGPRIAAGVEVAPFSAVDIYPLVAELLGLEPARDIDGTLEPWSGVLRP
ncbi:MAG: ectonucleotide pyrophosphatase/phosphodiesterase [Gemmatimonadetes bacterium]|nr:ectonucleotide pyrophosphatase/phosphodiesterase [Gemmatimonadota bacterium]